MYVYIYTTSSMPPCVPKARPTYTNRRPALSLLTVDPPYRY